MEKGKFAGIVTIVTLVLGIVGIFAPMAWERYKSTTALEVHMVALDKIVEVSHERIEIRYNTEPIPSMSRMTVHIVNTGRTPVRHVEPRKEEPPPKPLLLKIPENARLLDVSVDGASRKNLLDLQPKVVLGKANPPAKREPGARAEKAKPAAPLKYEAPGEVSVRLPVLYPNDYVRLSLLTAGHPGSLSVDGDFDNVRSVEFFDRTKDYVGGRRKIPDSVGMVGFFSAIMLFAALFVGLPILRRGYRARAAVEGGRFAIPKMQNRDAYLKYVEKELDYLSLGEKSELKRFLSDQPGQIDELNRKHFEESLLAAIRRSQPEYGVLLTLVTLASIGGLYVGLMLL